MRFATTRGWMGEQPAEGRPVVAHNTPSPRLPPFGPSPSDAPSLTPSLSRRLPRALPADTKKPAAKKTATGGKKASAYQNYMKCVASPHPLLPPSLPCSAPPG